MVLYYILIVSSSACVLVDVRISPTLPCRFLHRNACAPPHANEGAAWQGQVEAQAQLEMEWY